MNVWPEDRRPKQRRSGDQVKARPAQPGIRLCLGFTDSTDKARAMNSEQESFRSAMREAIAVFNLPAQHAELRDLSRNFWTALLDLELACDSDDWDEIRSAFLARRKTLGAPGDFGYGTPCGEALRKVYDTWNTACLARGVSCQQH